MDNRFTFKDFIFTVLFLIIIAAVLFSAWQFSYQESRLNDVKNQLQQLDATQKRQLTVLTDLRDALKSGITLNNSNTQPTAAQRIRRTNPDGSVFVYYPDWPPAPRDPRIMPDYATGDWLIRNLGNEPKLLTPFIHRDYVATLVQQMVLESLVQQNPDTLEYEPLLAESYEQSADGLIFRFTLRKQATFSDGIPVTANDVLFSYNTIMTDGVDCAPLRSFFSHVKSCKKIDERTVEFEYDEPYFEALGVVGGMNILPEHIYKFSKPEEFNRRGEQLVGAGQYKLQAWNRGQEIILVRNDNYWGPRPTFDRMIFKFIQNPQAGLQALQNGEIDIQAPDGDQFVKFSQDPEFQKKFTIHKYARIDSGYGYVGYNLLRPMFKDKATRQALTMLIDRKAIIQSFQKGLATEITGPFNPLSPQNDPTIEPWPYDPEAAQKKLQEAGWKPGPDGVLVRDGVRFEFDISMGSNNPVGERVATYIKEQFAKAGIRVRVTPWEFSVFSERLDNRNFDVAFLAWSGSVENDPYQIWHSDSIKDKGSNHISFSNPESDRLIEAGRRELDHDKRMEIWHQWQRLIHEEQPYTFLSAPMSRVFINNRLQNTEPYRVGLQYLDWFTPASQQKYH